MKLSFFYIMCINTHTHSNVHSYTHSFVDKSIFISSQEKITLMSNNFSRKDYIRLAEKSVAFSAPC